MDDRMIQMLNAQYPFISLLVYAGNEYVGVIQNRDSTVTTIYDFGALTDSDAKRSYLELASSWWWESNRSIPINIFLKGEWDQFKSCLKTFSNRDLEIIFGPVCSMQTLAGKKNKRRSITLVRKV